MGCGESKHSVATGNTITRKKSNAGEQSKKSRDIETLLENASLMVQPKEEGADHHNVNGNDNQANGSGDKEPAPNGDQLKDASENIEAAKENERSIANESPNRYFSSRKEEESIDGIEARSEKSEYDSPHPEADKESLLFNDKEKFLAQETIPEAENEGGMEKKEENLIEETKKETTAADKTKEDSDSYSAVAAATAEKNVKKEKVKEESVASEPSKGLKTA